ncbi:MAG: hypothetical protein PHI35_05655 [Victivallaceae bacterium]|nr:hypothetical protein [Victivallaceae bacterium]
MKFRLLLWLASLLIGLGVDGATIDISNVLKFDPTNSGGTVSETEAELRSIERQLQRMLRVTPTRNTATCVAAPSPAIPPLQLRVTSAGRRWQIEFDDSTPEWQSSPEFRKRLFGVLLAARRKFAQPPENPDYLPDWIAAGLIRRMELADGPARLLRQNRQLPVLRALLEADKQTSFDWLREVKFDELTGTEKFWFKELSLVLLEAACRSDGGKLIDYAVAHDHGEGEKAAYEKYLRPALCEAARSLGVPEWRKLNNDELSAAYLWRMTKFLAWNECFPKPPHILSRELAHFASGDPLPQRLLEADDGETTRLEKQREISAMRRGADAEYAVKLAQLSAAIGALPAKPAAADPEAAAKYAAALAELYPEISARTSQETLLDRVDSRKDRPLYFRRNQLDEAIKPSMVETETVRRLLDEAESIFSGF